MVKQANWNNTHLLNKFSTEKVNMLLKFIKVFIYMQHSNYIKLLDMDTFLPNCKQMVPASHEFRHNLRMTSPRMLVVVWGNYYSVMWPQVLEQEVKRHLKDGDWHSPVMENLQLCRFHPKRDIFWISVTISEIWRYVSASVTGCWGFCEWTKMAHYHFKFCV